MHPLVKKTFLERGKILLSVLPGIPEAVILEITQYAWRYLSEPFPGIFSNNEHESEDDDEEDDAQDGDGEYIYNKDIVHIEHRKKDGDKTRFVIVSEMNEDMLLSKNPRIIVPASNIIIVHTYGDADEYQIYRDMETFACGGCGFTCWQLKVKSQNSVEQIFIDSNPRVSDKNEIMEYKTRHDMAKIIDAVDPDLYALLQNTW